MIFEKIIGNIIKYSWISKCGRPKLEMIEIFLQLQLIDLAVVWNSNPARDTLKSRELGSKLVDLFKVKQSPQVIL